MSATQIRIGPYVKGEVPPPFDYTYLASDGVTPFTNLTGYTVKFNLKKPDGTSVTKNATVQDPVASMVRYVWVSGDFDQVGNYEAQFWAGNGLVRAASPKLVFPVGESVGTPPTI